MKTADSIHRAAEKVNSRKPVYRTLNTYALGPGQSPLLRSAPVLWSMQLDTRMYGYTGAGEAGELY